MVRFLVTGLGSTVSFCHSSKISNMCLDSTGQKLTKKPRGEVIFDLKIGLEAPKFDSCTKFELKLLRNKGTTKKLCRYVSLVVTTQSK